MDAALLPWDDERTPALAIVARGDQIRELGPTRFEVKSQSRPGRKYSVAVRRDRWSCSCAFHRSSRSSCIHILAVRFRAGLDGGSRVRTPAPSCVGCGSVRVIRFGRRHNRKAVVARYRCNDCGRRFTLRDGVPRSRYDNTTVAFALDLYYRGLSLRAVADHLRQAHGVEVAPATIYGWIERYAPRAAGWMDSLGARTGERWHVDETVAKVDGQPRWIWNAVDATTRFLVATQMTRLRRLRDVRRLMQRAKRATADRPLAVLTDGMPAYRQAIGRELAFRADGEVVNPHRRVPSIRAKTSNNLVERLNGTEKDRLRTMRGLHGDRAPVALIEGWRAHYNLVRTHSTIGTTPGQAAGLPNLGRFRWKEILRRSAERVPARTVEIEFVVE